MGVSALKPAYVSVDFVIFCVILLTSDRQLWTTCCELQEITALGSCELAHGLQQIFHTLAIHVEAVICLDGVHQCYHYVSLNLTAVEIRLTL